MKDKLKVYQVDNLNGLAALVVAANKKAARELVIAYCKERNVVIDYPINSKSACEEIDTSTPEFLAFVGY